MRTAAAIVLQWLCLGVAVAATPDPATVIQTYPLNPGHPYFVPTNQRVTTTVRFPREIGAPDGAVTVFTEDAARPGPAEYLVTWQAGDPYLTITPLKDSRMANLNIPYQGQTYVFYFYQVSDPLQAVAALNFTEPDQAAKDAAPADTAAAPVARALAPPASPYIAVTPARLVGFLDRLKLIHASAAGAELAGLVKAMKVEVAVSEEELNTLPGGGELRAPENGFVGVIKHGLNDAGLYQIVLIRAVRDDRLNCLGFICLVRNTSDQALTFDVNSFGARSGAEYLAQCIADAPAVLQPGEQAPAYFVVQAARNSPLSAVNEWKISAELVKPRLSPGAAIARRFAVPGGGS